MPGAAMHRYALGRAIGGYDTIAPSLVYRPIFAFHHVQDAIGYTHRAGEIAVIDGIGVTQPLILRPRIVSRVIFPRDFYLHKFPGSSVCDYIAYNNAYTQGIIRAQLFPQFNAIAPETIGCVHVRFLKNRVHHD